MNSRNFHSAISAFLEAHHHHKASNDPIISKLMCHFYLPHPLSHKHFNPWDVECLLSMLLYWTLASAITNFKLPWETASHQDLLQ